MFIPKPAVCTSVSEALRNKVSLRLSPPAEPESMESRFRFWGLRGAGGYLAIS